jgi:hypothetical protein
MVQYLSQLQRSSGKSHCAQLVGACMGASQEKLYLSMGGCGKTKVREVR